MLNYIRLLWLLPLLCACSPPKPELEPPAVRIVELRLSAANVSKAQEVDVSLRVRNGTEAVLPAHQLELEFRLDGRSSGSFSKAVTLDIPPLSGEILQFTTRLTEQQVMLLQKLGSGARSQVPYTLEGQAILPDQTMDLRYEGWLSENPGKPGSFR